MAGTLLAVFEFVVVCLGALLVVALIFAIVRRQHISRGASAVLLMGLGRAAGWRIGLARITPQSVEWFPLFGLNLRSRNSWHRGQLELGAPRDIVGPLPAMIVDPVQVDVTNAGAQFRIALAAADYTALRSWSESAPPGLNSSFV